MTFYDKVNEVIGQPYDCENNHCWHLVEHLVPWAPRVEIEAANLTTSVKVIGRELERSELQEIAPSDLRDEDIVVLGRGGTFHHAGVFCNGGIVHADSVGTIWQSLNDIKRTYPDIKGLRS